jgi:hypothetical protein
MKNCISSERANLFEPNVYIQLFAQISGNPAADDLIQAVKTAFLNNEATMSKIVLTKDGTAFYEKMQDSGCNISISHKSWKEIIKENEKATFNIHQGELVRAFIIPSDENVSLLIMAHHLAGDGKSMVYFLEDVLKALAGEELEYKPLRLMGDQDFSQDSNIPFLFKMYANRFNRKWNKGSRVFYWEDYYTVHEFYWKNHCSQIVYETFSAEEMSAIKLCAKEMNVTINSYIITAFLKADINNNNIGIAVDARTDNNHSMSNQVTGINVKHKYSNKKSFEENAKTVHQKVYKKLQKPAMKFFVLRFIPLFKPTLIDSVLLYIYKLYNNRTTMQLAKVMGYEGKEMRDLGITNLAKLDIDNKYGSYKIEKILFVAPAVSYGKRIISVSTLENEMTNVYRFMHTDNEAKEQEFFVKAIQNIRNPNFSN